MGKLIHNFTDGRDGAIPEGRLTMDSSGNLYGAALEGGYKQGVCKSASGCGVVYKFSPVAGHYQPSILYTFLGGTDGSSPLSPVTMDSSGNLYGIVFTGPAGVGDCGFPCGAVYKLTPNGIGGWTESTVYAFLGGAGGGIMNTGGVTLDGSGHVFGTTTGDGVINGLNACANGCGVTYEITP